MELEEARTTIANDDASFFDWVEASTAITSSEDSTLTDLVACLKRSGVPADTAATTLYVRTCRAREGDSSLSIVTDHGNWKRYLDENGFT